MIHSLIYYYFACFSLCCESDEEEAFLNIDDFDEELNIVIDEEDEMHEEEANILEKEGSVPKPCGCWKESPSRHDVCFLNFPFPFF